MKRTVSIIGGGPSAMKLAAKLDSEIFDITLYEKNSAIGRKFLVAGNGGFNLTRSEELEVFVGRYHPNYFLKEAIVNFSNVDLQNWFSDIGIETYVGTSKRVFPAIGTKPVQVLKAIMTQLEKNKVKINTGNKWIGFADDNSLIFEKKSGIINVKSDIVIFALGGASWRITGTDGSWLSYFIEKGIVCNPFEASNCGYRIDWPESLARKAAGKPLKNCTFKCGESFHNGEAVITSDGIEGSGVYPLGPEVRAQLANNKVAELCIDFKPQNSIEEIKEKLKRRKNKTLTRFLEEEMNLGEVKTKLLKDLCSKEVFVDTCLLARKIKNLEVKIIGLAPIDEAISTVGGIALNEVDPNYQLKSMPNHYVIGEMLDWDAPTGGYLLQACFSMGNNLAHHLNRIS